MIITMIVTGEQEDGCITYGAEGFCAKHLKELKKLVNMSKIKKATGPMLDTFSHCFYTHPDMVWSDLPNRFIVVYKDSLGSGFDKEDHCCICGGDSIEDHAEEFNDYIENKGD